MNHSLWDARRVCEPFFLKVRDQESTGRDLFSALDAEFDESNEQLCGASFRCEQGPQESARRACRLDAIGLLTSSSTRPRGHYLVQHSWDLRGGHCRPLVVQAELIDGTSCAPRSLPVGLRWAFRYADDFATFVRARSVWRILAMMVLLLRSVRFPLKWKKFRGGFKFDWVGYHIDLIRKEAGINDGRSIWDSRWCGGTMDQGTILVRNFLEALGRISFWSAGPMVCEAVPSICLGFKHAQERFGHTPSDDSDDPHLVSA